MAKIEDINQVTALRGNNTINVHFGLLREQIKGRCHFRWHTNLLHCIFVQYTDTKCRRTSLLFAIFKFDFMSKLIVVLRAALSRNDSCYHFCKTC